MRLHCVYSKQFIPIFTRFFEPTLRATDPNIEIIPTVFDVDGNGDFRSSGFNRALIYKWKKGLEIFYESEGETVLFTDVDIVFNRPVVPAVVAVMGDADIAVTPESMGNFRKCGLNVGVLAMRSSRRLRDFVSRMLDAMILEGEWDQRAFNRLLPKTKLKFRVLPHTFANGRIACSPRSVLYHATCTVATAERSSLEIKMDALEEAERRFRH